SSFKILRKDFEGQLLNGNSPKKKCSRSDWIGRVNLSKISILSKSAFLKPNRKDKIKLLLEFLTGVIDFCLVCYFTSSANSSATSSTLMLPSFSLNFTPSVSIVLQKGHPVAITSGCVSRASSVRSTLISFLPFSGSLNI